MRLTLDALQVLDAIDRKGSFAAAAEELNRVPSAVTYAVQKLEQDLDVLLFDRGGHRARLTPVGQTLLRDGRYLLDAAYSLEQRVKQLARGWETELVIACGDWVPVTRLYPLVREFDAINAGTRIKFLHEVFGGAWDALISKRAHLAIGASEAAPTGVFSRQMGHADFLFAVAPDHPLAQEAQPLPPHVIRRYRAVVAADSSRTLAPRTSALLSGQDTLTVPRLEDKLAAQIAGLGVGFLPAQLAHDALERGDLVELLLEEPLHSTPISYAWAEKRPARALSWWLKRLAEPDMPDRLLLP